MKKRFAFASLVLSCASAAAFAADRKVPSAEFGTITAAVAAAQPGDRILVGPGVYQENVVSTVANLQFVGKKAIWDGTLTDGTAGVCLTATGGGTVVQGFTFRAGQTSTAQVDLTGANCRVLKCVSRGPSARFLKVTGDGVLVDGCRLFAVNSDAIVIAGNNAVVQRLFASQCDDDVVDVTGAQALVTRCVFQLNEDSHSVSVTGAGARVTFNVFSFCDSAITVDGADAVVERNRLISTGEIQVRGDNLAVRRNSIANAPDDDYGIRLLASAGAGGGVVEDNVISQTTQAGIVVAAAGVTVRRNRVSFAGTESTESAVEVTGANNIFEDIAVAGGGTHGFRITGASNRFTRCKAVDCAADGFHVEGATNTLDQCSATLCTGEGLDNAGLNTTVTGCTFKGNRLDVANDGSFANAATFATDNSFTTGGVAQAPQVD
jgi:hypothetical protein